MLFKRPGHQLIHSTGQIVCCTVFGYWALCPYRSVSQKKAAPHTLNRNRCLRTNHMSICAGSYRRFASELKQLPSTHPLNLSTPFVRPQHSVSATKHWMTRRWRHRHELTTTVSSLFKGDAEPFLPWRDLATSPPSSGQSRGLAMDLACGAALCVQFVPRLCFRVSLFLDGG